VVELQNVLIWSPYTVFSAGLTGSAHALYTGSTFIHQWGLSALACLALLAAWFPTSLGLGPQGLGSVIGTLAVFGSLIAFREYARRICLAGLQIKTAIQLDCGAAVMQCSSLLLLVWLMKLSASSALTVMGIAGGAAGVGWLMWSRRSFAFSAVEVRSDLGRNWTFGKWLLAGNLAIYLGSELYPWILTGYHGTGATGFLAASLGVASLANPFLQGTRNFLGPKLAQGSAQGGAERLRALVFKSTLAIALAAAPVCAVIMAFGGSFAVLIYGGNFAGLGMIIAVLAGNVFCLALSLGVDYGIWVQGRPDLCFKIEIIRLLVTLSLGLWLVKAWGPLGAAWGLLLGSGAVTVALALIFIRLTYRAKSSDLAAE
jgi:O-antigen/teichoic acid export membrane protein